MRASCLRDNRRLGGGLGRLWLSDIMLGADVLAGAAAFAFSTRRFALRSHPALTRGRNGPNLRTTGCTTGTVSPRFPAPRHAGSEAVSPIIDAPPGAPTHPPSPPARASPLHDGFRVAD